MSAILILKSLNQRQLTNQLVDLWLKENEMFITNKTFSNDRYSVEITFIDEERKKSINLNEMLIICRISFLLQMRI